MPNSIFSKIFIVFQGLSLISINWKLEIWKLEFNWKALTVIAKSVTLSWLNVANIFVDRK